MKKKGKYQNSDDNGKGENVVEHSSDEGYDEVFEDSVESEGDLKEDNNVQNKRKRKIGETSVRSKKFKKEIKPPTAEEMIRLRETENLYQSNLFRLQIEEMVKELKPRKSDNNAIKHWMQEFKQFCLKLEDSENIMIDDKKKVAEDIVFPLPDRVWDVGESIRFLKPLDVKIMGSYKNGTVLGPYFVLDIALIIPKKYYQKDDYLNQKYHYKRAFYLCIIASKLKGSKLVNKKFELKFWHKNGDILKPNLLFRPEGKMTQFVEISLNILPEENPFKINRFLPEKNNIRPKWWGLQRNDSGKLPSTPNYNMSILEDIVAERNEQLKIETFEGKQNLKEAVILLSVWMKQRKLFEGYGAFNMHLLSMFMVYLIKKQKINNYMSSYQITRNVWLAFSQTDWLKDGLSLYDNDQDPIPCSKDIFHNFFDIVFIDSTGYYNLSIHLNKNIYLKVKEEAVKAVKYLNDPNVNSFQVLFMTNMPFLHQYDHFISFTDPTIIEGVVDNNSNDNEIMDHSGHKLPLFINLLTELLHKGLCNRLNSLCMQPLQISRWSINEKLPDTALTDVLIFGMRLNPETALNVIEKGPEGNDTEAAKFREFWGDKCELRRFRDGTICESVCWNSNDASLNERRMITAKIVKFLLKNKLDIPSYSYNYIANQLDNIMINNYSPEKHHEESTQAVHKVYEAISQQLIDITNIPLNIVSVRCISPVYRFTEVFPPVISKFGINRSCKLTEKGVIFNEDNQQNVMPFYVQPIDLVLQLSMTQKWPNDIKAGKRLIAAFNIVIASSLKKNYGLSCQITTDYITVQKEGYMFRLHLGYSKEIALLKQQITAEGVTLYRDTPESILLEKKFINLPKLTGAIYGLSQTHSGYGYATCLAKRWLNSHLIDDYHFPTVVIELLMARLFISPEPFDVVLQPLTAFLRFLNYIATTNWYTEPIIVNFNNLLTREQIVEIEKSFKDNRTTLPPLVLATPYDLVGTLWTKNAPTLPTLIRLSKLAAASLKMLDIFLSTSPKHNNIIKIFEAPLTPYDAIITLNKDLLPRRMQYFDLKKPEVIKNKIIQLPIAGFDPAEKYLNDLRVQYSDYALFFYDNYGGTKIGVIFKPTFLETKDFKTTHIGPRVPTLTDGKVSLIPNKEALLNGFYILGSGFVQDIELK